MPLLYNVKTVPHVTLFKSCKSSTIMLFSEKERCHKGGCTNLAVNLRLNQGRCILQRTILAVNLSLNKAPCIFSGQTWPLIYG